MTELYYVNLFMATLGNNTIIMPPECAFFSFFSCTEAQTITSIASWCLMMPGRCWCCTLLPNKPRFWKIKRQETGAESERRADHLICEMLPWLQTRLTTVMLRGGDQQQHHPLTRSEPNRRHAKIKTRNGEARQARRRCSTVPCGEEWRSPFIVASWPLTPVDVLQSRLALAPSDTSET